ncbi:RICIN domain-containing protein [Dorea sp.]
MKERLLQELTGKRKRCVKYFQMNEKGVAAAVYPGPVHYEEDGEWKDIDNRLEAVTEEGREVYHNKASDVKVKFAGETGTGDLVSVEKNGLKVSWKLDTEEDQIATESTGKKRAKKKACRFRVLTEPEFPQDPGEVTQKPEEEAASEDEPEEGTTSADELASDEVSADDSIRSEKAGSAEVKSEDTDIAEEGTEEKSEDVDVAEDTEAKSEGTDIEGETEEKSEDADITDDGTTAGKSENTDKEDLEKDSGTLEDEVIRAHMGVKHLAGEGIYENILSDVDVHYIIQGEKIKENIRLKTKEAAEQELTFTFQHPGLTMKTETDGSLGLYKDEEKVFWFEKPYMYDNNGCLSTEVVLQAEPFEEGSKVSVIPDKEWLLEEDRAYPVVIDPMTETEKPHSIIEDTYVFSGGKVSENPEKVFSYGSFVVGRSYENGKLRALLRFRNLPDIGKGSILYAAKMYIWQYEYSASVYTKIPLLAQEITGTWDEKSVRWNNQPAVAGTVLDYKEVGQVTSGNTTTITPIGFDVTKLARKWYNTGVNNGIMIRSQYESEPGDSKNAYARFYASDHPKVSSKQYPSGVFYYRNVTGLEDYQSYHEQAAGRGGMGYTNDYTGNVVWIHPDVETEGGPLMAEVKHVYNLSEADTPSRLGYGWTLSCLQRVVSSGINDYPYKYTDEDGTAHYFYKDTTDGNKIKDEDGLGLVITSTSGPDYDHYLTMEGKDKTKYIFGGDGYLRFIEDLDGNKVTIEYEPNASQNYIDYITDATGARIDIVYKQDASLSRILEIKDTAGRSIHYDYDSAGNLSAIHYPDGKKTTFTYDGSHRLLTVTGPEGYGIRYEYTQDFRIWRVSKITEFGENQTVGQEMKISYENGNTTIFEEPGLDGELSQTADNQKMIYHFDNMGRPTDILDSDGCANTYEYYTTGMKNHKLHKDGSTQKTIYGLLRNHLFDPEKGDAGWYGYRIADKIKTSIVRKDGYAGTKSAYLNKTDADSEEGICQDVTLEAGTYTFSAYMKITGLSKGVVGKSTGAGLGILHADGSRNVSAKLLKEDTDTAVDDGWERMALTFKLQKKETVTVFAGLFGRTGQVYVSGTQLESGKAVNKLNLITNPGCDWMTGDMPDYWKKNEDISGGKTVMTNDKGRCFIIHGQRDKNPVFWQEVNITGKEGDIYNLSCWVKGCGIPDKRYAVSAAVLYDNAPTKWHHFACNPNIEGWQFVSGSFSTSDDDTGTNATYKSIHIFLHYTFQIDQALFKGVQLVRDDSESYVYDDEGNLINAVSAAEKDHFVSNKNGMLTKLGGIDGTEFEYCYDSKNHMKKASNSEGVSYMFDYNAKGQPTAMRASGGKNMDAATPGRIYYLREKYSGLYLDVEGQKVESRTPLILQEYSGSGTQKWKLKQCDDGYLQFELAEHAGYNVDLLDASDKEGATVAIHQHNMSDAQKWRLAPQEDGSYQITSKAAKDKKGLTNYEKGTAKGQKITSHTLGNYWFNQCWYLEPVDEGTLSEKPENNKIVTLRVMHSGQYLDVYFAKTEAGAPLAQDHFNGGRNQQYRMKSCGNGYYQLSPMHAPGMVIAKSGKNSKGYERLALEERKENAANQMFRFEEIEAGKGTGYAIVCKDGNVALDVMDRSYVNGTDVILTAHGAVQRNKWWIIESVSDRMESTMEYTSDARQIKKITDVRGYETSFTYDAKNRLLKSCTDARGGVTSYEYDPNTDQMTRVVRKMNGKDYDIVYTYDGEKIKNIRRNGMDYGYTYDIYGNQNQMTIAGKAVEKITYRNKDGLEDRTTYATGESIRNVYDSEERLVSQYLVHTDGTEEKLYTNIFDNYGNVVRHIDERNQLTYDYQHDLIGRILGSTSSDGMNLRIAYDSKNRVKENISRMDKKGHRTQYIYVEAGKQQKPGLGYGVKIDGTERITYQYDRLGRYVKKTVTYPGGQTSDTTYTYVFGKKDGTTTALVNSVLRDGVETFYRYDGVGNITEVLEKTAADSQPVSRFVYEYDLMNQLVKEEDKKEGSIRTYEYDAGGNLLKYKKYTVKDGKQTLVLTDSYAYGNTWKDQMTSYNGNPVTYDDMGNPLTYLGMKLSWEKGRELVQVEKGGNTTRYVYDSDGRRIQKTGKDGTTHYYLNGSAVIAQKTDVGERMDFLYDDKGNVFAVDYKDKLYFYQTNLQGDITGIVDSNGNQVVTYTYDSWGKLLASTDNSGVDLAKKNPFRYRGYYYDVETGFYYLNDRYYDPKARRMLSADDNINLMMSIEFYGKNLYLYCDNNPVSRRDDEGEFWHILAAGAVSAAIGMATAVLENKVSGNAWYDGLAESAVTGFVSGAIAGSGLGPVGQAIGQGTVTLAAEGYSLWEKSKTKQKITVYDVTYAVVDVAASVVPGTRTGKDIKAAAKHVENIANYRSMRKTYKIYIKEGQMVKRIATKARLKNLRGEIVSHAVKQTKPSKRSFILFGVRVARVHRRKIRSVLRKIKRKLKKR